MIDTGNSVTLVLQSRNDVRSNEAGAARYKNFHILALVRFIRGLYALLCLSPKSSILLIHYAIHSAAPRSAHRRHSTPRTRSPARGDPYLSDHPTGRACTGYICWEDSRHFVACSSHRSIDEYILLGTECAGHSPVLCVAYGSGRCCQN